MKGSLSKGVTLVEAGDPWGSGFILRTRLLKWDQKGSRLSGGWDSMLEICGGKRDDRGTAVGLICKNL